MSLYHEDRKPLPLPIQGYYVPFWGFLNLKKVRSNTDGDGDSWTVATLVEILSAVILSFSTPVWRCLGTFTEVSRGGQCAALRRIATALYRKPGWGVFREIIQQHKSSQQKITCGGVGQRGGGVEIP